jgi:hypothetical protein
MAIQNVRLADTNPTTVFQAEGQQAVTVIYLCNTTNDDVTVNVFCVDMSDSSAAGDSNKIYSELVLTGNDTYVIDTEKLILSDGDLIEVAADTADAVTVTVSTITI